jgi:predicted nucleic acid-binding protein
MIYLLDTSTFSALMRRDARAQSKAAALTRADRGIICPITRGEILHGLIRLPQGRRRDTLQAEAANVFARFSCLPVPEAAGDRYAQIKSDAESIGTPLDENDLWIAATAITLDAILVTTDSDFQRVRELKIEDWTAA